MSAQDLLKVIETKFGTEFKTFIESSCIGSTKSKKVKEQKEGPKRPLTPYFIYASENRGLIKEKNPEMKVTDISKVLGQQWKELTTEQKDVYVKKSKEQANKTPIEA